MRNLSPLVGLCLALLVLAGCALINPPEKQGRGNLDDFVYALRWMQFGAAANFMQPQFRDDFLRQFRDTRDLTIVDVRLSAAKVLAEGRRVEAEIEMDYYLLPSPEIKTFPIEQTWVFFETGQGTGDYLITTPFPTFP